MLKESPEKFVAEFAARIDPAAPQSTVLDLSAFQQFDADHAVVALVYSNIADGGLGIVVWNLEPGQENDYHVHPTTEHLHVILAGEAQYSLGDHPPITVGVGQAVMVPAGMAHGVRNVGSTRCSYLAVTNPGEYQKVLAAPPDNRL